MICVYLIALNLLTEISQITFLKNSPTLQESCFATYHQLFFVIYHFHYTNSGIPNWKHPSALLNDLSASLVEFYCPLATSVKEILRVVRELRAAHLFHDSVEDFIKGITEIA